MKITKEIDTQDFEKLAKYLSCLDIGETMLAEHKGDAFLIKRTKTQEVKFFHCYYTIIDLYVFIALLLVLVFNLYYEIHWLSYIILLLIAPIYKSIGIKKAEHESSRIR